VEYIVPKRQVFLRGRRFLFLPECPILIHSSITDAV
jgi:hypothetical protein